MDDLQKSAHILDARGQRVSQLDPYELWLKRRIDAIPADELRTLAREIGFGLVRGQRVLFYVALVCLAIIGAALFEYGTRMVLAGQLDLRRLLLRAVPMLSPFAATVIFWLGARRARVGRTTRVMLAHRRCPHCGYDLRGLPRLPEDGATRCPECGCAWLLPAQTV